MKDLTAAEMDELAGEVATIVGDMALIGLDCVVILSGRGVNKVAYSKELAPYAPELIASAYRQSKNYNARNAN